MPFTSCSQSFWIVGKFAMRLMTAEPRCEKTVRVSYKAALPESCRLHLAARCNSDLDAIIRQFLSVVCNGG